MFVEDLSVYLIVDQSTTWGLEKVITIYVHMNSHILESVLSVLVQTRTISATASSEEESDPLHLRTSKFFPYDTAWVKLN